MLATDRPYVVMGLLDTGSIAYAVGQAIERLGGRVLYTLQSPVLKKRYWDRSAVPGSGATGSAPDLRYCDVSREEEVRALFAEIGPVAGVVHSIAYANPRTCLGPELHTDAVDDILRSYQVSCQSLATVARHAAAAMPDGGAIVAMTFDSAHAWPAYNWMGVHKAALEALVRALARRHGRDGIRVNAVSAGPLHTTAAMKIPGFERLARHWEAMSPLPWDPDRDKAAVADAAVFLLGSLSRAMTGQTLMVDGGASIVGGELLDDEKKEPPEKHSNSNLEQPP